MEELTGQALAEIQNLCKLGDEHAEGGRHSEALKAYWSAWALIPEPKTNWDAATWVLAAIGDANFLSADYAACRDNLTAAMSCPDAIGNPFLHLRLGQSQFELGDLDRAADELMRAYMGAGPEIFKDQDPKYLSFLKTRAKDIQLPKKKWQFWK
jgi:tetratricopeptide (TPR) repeat protein